MNRNDYINNQVIVDSVFRENKDERTEKIYILDRNGKREGPFIRKIFNENSGLGEIYKVLLNERNVGFNCDGIPNVYYFEKKDDKLIFIEECFIGISLTDFLKKHNFDIKLFNRIYLQVCEAVEYLHTAFKKPIIHRGVNPENILVNEEKKKIQIIDFGISQHYNEGEDQSILKFGSKGSFKADVRNDVYSLGKVLEFMMDGNNWADGKVELPNDIYKEIVNKATDSNPGNRYKSVNTLLIEFSSAAKGGKWLQKISEDKTIITLGHIWNVLLTLVYIAFSVLAIWNVSTSQNNIALGMPVAEKIIYCVIAIIFVMYPIYFILIFKPSLRKIFKSLPRLKFIHYFAFAIASCSIVLILSLIAQLF